MKQPAFQFYTGDWLKDPKLSMCSPLTRGIWIDAICAMHESDRSGSLTGTPDQLARVLRCTPSDIHSAIAELKATGAADIRECNGFVTLINRRMKREQIQRVESNNRVKKHRCNADVTDLKQESNVPSSSSSSSSCTTSVQTVPPKPPSPEKPKADRVAMNLPRLVCEHWKVVVNEAGGGKYKITPEDRTAIEQFLESNPEETNPEDLAKDMKTWLSDSESIGYGPSGNGYSKIKPTLSNFCKHYNRINARRNPAPIQPSHIAPPRLDQSNCDPLDLETTRRLEEKYRIGGGFRP